MIKRSLLSLLMLTALCPKVHAQGQNFDLSGYQTGVGPTLNGANAQAYFTASGAQNQYMTQAQIQQAQNFQATQLQNEANASTLEANAIANGGQAAALAGGAGASSAAAGDIGRTSNPTGTGPSGLGGLSTNQTGTQAPVTQLCGTMGLAPVFGYGGVQQSPGGYVAGILLPFGLGTVRVPSAVALPGGGAIGLPAINTGAINSAVSGF